MLRCCDASPPRRWPSLSACTAVQIVACLYCCCDGLEADRWLLLGVVAAASLSLHKPLEVDEVGFVGDVG